MCRARTGIGVKTAAQLINEYGDLDTLLARAGEIKQPKRRETLTDPDERRADPHLAEAREAGRRRAARNPLDDLGLHQPDGKALVAFLQAMEFTHA